MIDATEVLLFLRQLGIAVAGATAFWGSLFLLFSRKTKEKRESALWQGIAQKLLRLFYPAVFLYAIAWFILTIRHCAFCVNAHEGIALAERIDKLALILQQQSPFVLALVLISLGGLGMLFLQRRFILARLAIVYGISFILISILLLSPWAISEAETAREYIAHALHNWHSIFTVGSVMIVDFLFLALKFNLRPFLKKIFPLITLGIWLGLGLDFANSGLVFREAFSPEPRVLFMQTLIGIIIINGALLAGPIARAIISFQERMRREYLPPSLKKIAGISGAISITAWTSITALDGFRFLTLAYWQLALFYLCFLGIILVSRDVIEKLLERYAGD